MTDLNNVCIKRDRLECQILESWRADAGASHRKLLETSLLVGRRYSMTS